MPETAAAHHSYTHATSAMRHADHTKCFAYGITNFLRWPYTERTRRPMNWKLFWFIEIKFYGHRLI